MKILQLCHKPPFPSNDGGSLAMHANTLALQELGHDVHIITFETPKHPLSRELEFEDYFKKTHLQSVSIDSTPTSIGAAMALIQGGNYFINRFDSSEIRALIQQKADEYYDLIWFESLFSTAFIDVVKSVFPAAKLVYRSHNIESILWKTRLAEYSPIKRFILNALTKRLEVYEQQILNSFDGILAISANDAKWLEKNSSIPTTVLPYFNWKSNGGIQNQVNSNPKRFLFLGSLDWEPNVKGVKWLIESVWPKVKKQLPDAQLHIAGRNMSDDMKKPTDGVVYRGQIESVNSYYEEGEIVVVPLFSGSGIRIKIVEALSNQKVVITTDIGLSGLDFTPNQDLVVANTANDFAQTMLDLALHDVSRNQFKELGYHAYNRMYSKEAYLDKLNHFFKTISE